MTSTVQRHKNPSHKIPVFPQRFHFRFRVTILVIRYIALAFPAFLLRDALVHSAVLRLHVVRLFVCPSVKLVDQDHIGWKSGKLIARTLSPTPSLFVAKRPSTYSQGNMGKFGGD